MLKIFYKKYLDMCIFIYTLDMSLKGRLTFKKDINVKKLFNKIAEISFGATIISLIALGLYYDRYFTVLLLILIFQISATIDE